MANERQKLRHIRSSVVNEGGVPKLPTPSMLEYGEIAINFASGHETLSIKNNSGDVVSFSSDNVIEKKFSGYTAQSDWSESDTGKTSYILNKPTKLSQFSNDEKFIVSGNVVSALSTKQNTINDLEDIRNNASSGASAYSLVVSHTGNTGIHLPVVTSNDNGKVLKVVDGSWALVSTVTVYSGSIPPQSNLGNNGDIYIQTNS